MSCSCLVLELASKGVLRSKTTGLLKPVNSTKDYFNVSASRNINRVIIVAVNFSTLSSIRNLTDYHTLTQIKKAT